MKKVVLVGKMYKRDKTNGPTAVMYSLKDALNKIHINCEEITLNEECGKIKYLFRLIHLVSYKRAIINVHVNGFISAVVVCIISKINKRCDYYLTVHGIYREQTKYYNAGWRRSIYCLMEKYVYNSFPNLICVSELCKSKVLEYYKPKGRVFVIENAVELQGNELEDKKSIGKKFLFLGGAQAVKGYEKLLKVFDIQRYLQNHYTQL